MTEIKSESNFLLGCNYWASHAGADMWKRWDSAVVEQDIKDLHSCGVSCLRIFPNWRDFQPVFPLYGQKGNRKELRLENDVPPSNPYYLDETMLEHFGEFCRIAETYGMKLIVGLVTGWMSGRLFIPPALYGKNLFTDPLALKLQQLLVKGIVTAFKGEASIYAWDLGNECNCMGKAATEDEAYNWTLTITNAIKSADPVRPVISGMHSLELEGIWNIQDQGEITDVLTTHPYPLWVEHCSLDPIHSFRTLLHATAQNQYYKSVGKKPCLVEEIGTMGPMICNDRIAADFMRVNLFSNWANGAAGLLWWCANEQSHLTAPPYEWNMCERELGMRDREGRPKPMLLEMKQFSEFLESTELVLPEPKADGVCILSKGQDHWGNAYMSYILAKQAGVTLHFAYCSQTLPESPVYLLPSVKSECMYQSNYKELKQKVYDGATLYLSLDNAFLTEFEEFTGLEIEYSCKTGYEGYFQADGEEIPYRKTNSYVVKETRAKVLSRDEKGIPVFTVADYGKGKVYVLNFPMESMLLDRPEAFEQPYSAVYRTVFNNKLKDKIVRTSNDYVAVTEHHSETGHYAVVINYSAQEQELKLRFKENWRIADVLYGEIFKIGACNAVIIKLEIDGGII